MAATVLVIDDDSTVRDSVVAYLDDCDYDMQSTGSGQEALDLIDVSVPDAVICDLKMPGMHGIQLLEKLRENHPDLPVIVVSVRKAVSCITQMTHGPWKGPSTITKPTLLELIRVEQV